MHLLIHRGTHEIGGSCVELRADNSRILLDFGMPLVNQKQEKFDSNSLKGKSVKELIALKILPDIKGLYKDEIKETNEGISAILLTHSHLDHYGFIKYVRPDIPIYASEGAKEIIEISEMFTPNKMGKVNTKIIDKSRPFQVGDFKIRPYLVDHSAFDALAFLIEAEGKRIFYSGDFRGHGRKSILFKRIIEKPPQNIDYLLMEGSMLGRGTETYKTEENVQGEMEELLKSTDNICFLSASSQNIDRLVSAYKACVITGRTFIIDLYTAFILERLKKISKGIPQFDWNNVRVKFFKYHANCLVKAGYRTMLYKFNKKKIELHEINNKKAKILMLLKDNSIFDKVIEHLDKINGAKLIYSMWHGYLTDAFKNKCAKLGIDIVQFHTSGHAFSEDLKKFVDALKPDKLIPIHTFYPQDYKKLFGDIVWQVEDGEINELK